ncbi:MAG TPA: AAA family ATPase [Gemmatimonadaceae bacterium]|nr:AAA family ATPase [Gemmatimonadaceae bacterium]
MPHFYRTSDEFVAAAQAAVAGAAPRQPVAVLVAEVDPSPAPAGVLPPAESAIGAVAEVLRHTLREDDMVGRLGDRLIVVIPGAAAEDGRAAGDRLCAAVRIHAFGEGLGQLTLSVGSASAPEHGHAFDAVSSAAGTALVRIQAQGRDGAAAAPLPHHEWLHRPLSIDRFAGRAQELGLLVRWLDEAASGQPRVVSVFGEAGLGTATLLRQLEGEVRLRGGLFVSVASPDLAVRKPYGVWQSFLRATHRFPTAPDKEWQELHHLESSLRSSETSGHTGSQYRLLGELTDYVRALAANRPLVIVLDEMQWADGTTWDALEHLLSQLDVDRMMICLAHRPDSAYEGSTYRQMLARHDFSREITLSRLTRDEVKQWLEAAFHRQQVAREFLAFLYRHTEGNPLFIAQLLRALGEEGAIWWNGSRWEWSPVSELRLPAGRRALLARRVARFSSSTQAVLGTAAIVGREFDVGLLVAAAAGSEPAVRLAISEAVNAGLLRATNDRKTGAYAFDHDEIAEVLVAAVPSHQVRQLHYRVAQALEKRRPDRLGEIALHYDAAEVHGEAYRAGQAAARAAESVYAHVAARDYLQIAARNSTTPGELAEIRIALAHIAETLGHHDEVEELCDLAIEWFEGQQDERRALTLRRMRERARMELGQPARITLDALVKLDDEAKRLGFGHERVALLMMTSQTYGRLGDQATAARIATECVAMAENIDDPALLGDALNRLGNSMASESPAQALAAYERALDLYESVGDVRGQARSYGNMGNAAQFEARLEEAQNAFARSISVAKAAGIPDLWGSAAVNLGVLLQKCGEYDRARELFGEALALFAAVKHSEFQLAALYNMAHVERELGLWESAGELYEATRPLAERIGQYEIQLGAIAGSGICALELGRLDTAQMAAREVESLIEDRPNWFQGREIAEALIIRTAAAAGRDRDALSRFDRAVALAEATDVYNAAWLTAICADSLRRIDPARVNLSVDRYSVKVRSLGYPEMTRRYDVLTAE